MKIYIINDMVASSDDVERLLIDTRNPKTNPIKSMFWFGNIIKILTY